ncbi:hypothetical protein Acr_00g0057070 [Actinidia rufa]|uniref:Transposase (putative) gypsy type domain-containing protein n=1 Tax=Actinidia rufa TaxID=165716 RepID=A0A7J0DMN1_9ERIC|nr:hypothetical protein Acr_00g0057070 [Actinidia rufa]
MPHRGGTMNVGVLEKMESYIDLIHSGSGKIVHLAHRRGGGDGSRKVADIGDLDNSLPSWVSKHLGEKSFMTDELNELLSSPPKESSDLGEDPEMENRPPPEREARIPKDDETIVFTHPGEVAFYEAAFHVGLRLPIHPMIRRILHFYNIYPTQLVPNVWRSVV